MNVTIRLKYRLGKSKFYSDSEISYINTEYPDGCGLYDNGYIIELHDEQLCIDTITNKFNLNANSTVSMDSIKIINDETVNIFKYIDIYFNDYDSYNKTWRRRTIIEDLL